MQYCTQVPARTRTIDECPFETSKTAYIIIIIRGHRKGSSDYAKDILHSPERRRVRCGPVRVRCEAVRSASAHVIRLDKDICVRSLSTRAQGRRCRRWAASVRSVL
ncbi:hypothetical protein EVAR_46354_1 [Eumeta japonica]|uniref:Uncharacterized protein n=1 Tax=Eumeta variegata TaxID=151549 RepID=A0A4C1WUF3_EUMVA|nr:hypothetical protein EVAR_46354_1 [Eumeta japonica]